MELSVIIPTYRRRQVLERTLPTVLNQNFPPDRFEVLVVIDGPDDGTAEMLSALHPACSLKILHTPQRGAAAARNAGLGEATGDLVLFLDDDLLCPPNLLSLHRAAHTACPPSVVHGPIYVAAESRRSMIRYLTESFYESYYRPLDPQMELQYPDDIRDSLAVLSSLVNSSIPRSCLLDCGGFDEEIRAAEDLELGFRLWKSGCIFRYLPSAAAEELYTKSSADYLQGQAKALGRGELRLSRKHHEYRACSSLPALVGPPTLKKRLLQALVRSPVSPVPLLSWPLRFEEQFYSVPALRQFGVRLFQLAERIARMRSALEAAGSWKTLRDEFGRTCPVLLYHHVGPLRPGTYASLNVSAERFEQQVRWLAKRGYTGIRPSDWLSWLHDGSPLPPKPVILSFDDGYADLHEFALPVLERYGFRGAVYIVTERLGGTNTWDEAQGSGTLRLMTAEQIRYWDARRFEFGGHSRTHADLPTLSAPASDQEIAGSRRDLAALLEKDVLSFAYPYGEHNAPVREQTRSQYSMAFSIREGYNTFAEDRYQLRRCYIGPKHSLPEFALAVARGKNLRLLDDLRINLALRTRLRKVFGRRTVSS